MTRATFSVVIALLFAMSAAVGSGWPTSALGSGDGPSVSPPAPSATSPLLDALAFAPPGIVSFEFTDWTALKALHGGADITSASPLEERQRLVLDMVHSDASQFDFGIDRLATWPELWGWDNTDLAWEATWISGFGPDVRVLRFREDWGPEPFIARLEGYGYSRRERPHGTVLSDAPDFTAGPGTEAILNADELLLTAAPHSVAISPDGRTVAIGQRDRANEILKRAARADPGAVVASPVGRVAVALGRPVAAIIVDGEHACSDPVEEDIHVNDDAAALASSLGPLHPYLAFGIGYERAGPGEPAVGRYAFAYEQATQATADLPGRRTLIDEGWSSRHGKRYRDAAFTLVDASADGRELVLDVAPLYDTPQVLFDLLISRSLSFAVCD